MYNIPLDSDWDSLSKKKLENSLPVDRIRDALRQRSKSPNQISKEKGSPTQRSNKQSPSSPLAKQAPHYDGSSPEEDYPRRDSPPDNYFNGSYEKDIRGDSKTEFDNLFQKGKEKRLDALDHSAKLFKTQNEQIYTKTFDNIRTMQGPSVNKSTIEIRNKHLSIGSEPDPKFFHSFDAKALKKNESVVEIMREEGRSGLDAVSEYSNKGEPSQAVSLADTESKRVLENTIRYTGTNVNKILEQDDVVQNYSVAKELLNRFEEIPFYVELSPYAREIIKKGDSERENKEYLEVIQDLTVPKNMEELKFDDIMNIVSGRISGQKLRKMFNYPERQKIKAKPKTKKTVKKLKDPNEPQKSDLDYSPNRTPEAKQPGSGNKNIMNNTMILNDIKIVESLARNEDDGQNQEEVNNYVEGIIKEIEDLKQRKQEAYKLPKTISSENLIKDVDKRLEESLTRLLYIIAEDPKRQNGIKETVQSLVQNAHRLERKSFGPYRKNDILLFALREYKAVQDDRLRQRVSKQVLTKKPANEDLNDDAWKSAGTFTPRTEKFLDTYKSATDPRSLTSRSQLKSGRTTSRSTSRTPERKPWVPTGADKDSKSYNRATGYMKESPNDKKNLNKSASKITKSAQKTPTKVKEQEKNIDDGWIVGDNKFGEDLKDGGNWKKKV